MEIYQLKGLDYHINEREAFDKSVFNAAEYDVTLAIPEGTDLNSYIKEGDQIAGNYTVNGLTTDFESIVQDVSINRQFQAGYDMYNLRLSENILSVARSSILDVQDGGTGSGELNGILKGNGLSPVSTALDGTDYWSPETLVVDNRERNWTTLTVTGGSGASAKWCVKNGTVYIVASGNWGSFSGVADNTKWFGNIAEPEFRPSIELQNSASSQGGAQMMAWRVRPNGDVGIVCSDTTTNNRYGAFVASYPVGF